MGQHFAILHLPGKGRIGKDDVKLQFVEVFPGLVVVRQFFLIRDSFGRQLLFLETAHKVLPGSALVPGPGIEAADIGAEDVGVAVSGNQHQGAGGFGGADLEVDAPKIFGGVLVFAQLTLIIVVSGVAPVHGVQQKAARAASGIHDILFLRRIEHAYAHLDHMARGEKLSLLLLGLGG